MHRVRFTVTVLLWMCFRAGGGKKTAKAERKVKLQKLYGKDRFETSKIIADKVKELGGSKTKYTLGHSAIIMRSFDNGARVSAVSSRQVEITQITIGESFSMALAIAILCFSPPDNVSPASPTIVSKPSGRAIIKS